VLRDDHITFSLDAHHMFPPFLSLQEKERLAVFWKDAPLQLDNKWRMLSSSRAWCVIMHHSTNTCLKLGTSLSPTTFHKTALHVSVLLVARMPLWRSNQIKRWLHSNLSLA